jgi:hypothetical protein
MQIHSDRHQKLKPSQECNGDDTAFQAIQNVISPKEAGLTALEREESFPGNGMETKYGRGEDYRSWN